MKRRNFIKGLALGAALPAIGLKGESASMPLQQKSGEATAERFTGESRARSGMALGGIGAGCLELRKDGCFYNWSIFNNFPKETGPEFTLPVASFADPMASNLFFKVRYQVEGEEPKMKLFQLPDGMNEGGQMGIAYYFPWMKSVAGIDYSARFPFAKLVFSDPEMPFEVSMTAWSPFIPHDVKHSSLPAVFFDFSVESRTTRRVSITLMMSARNTVGFDTFEKWYQTEVHSSANALTVNMTCEAMDTKASNWGQIALSSVAGDSTYYCGWSSIHPYYEYVLRNADLPNLDLTLGTKDMKKPMPAWMPELEGFNTIDAGTGKKVVKTDKYDPDSRLFCTVGRSFDLTREKQVQNHTFLYSWNFPNLYASNGFRKRSDIIEGHYYSRFFDTAFEVAQYAIEHRDDLHGRTKEFQDNFFDSSAAPFVLEQVNSQLNTFITSGRLVKSGDFGVLEGLASTWAWGPIATIDVMLYGTAPIIALFPELQKSTMRCHSKAQNAKGQVAHGLEKHFPISEDGPGKVSERIDLPGEYVLLILRDFFWSNDKDYLQELYPSLKKAIDYNLQYRCLAGDQIPIMTGIPQESSYDNFPMYGYASYLLSQWVCVMAGAVQAAEVMGDTAAHAQYTAILDKARKAMEAKLWNGQYYRLYNNDWAPEKPVEKNEGCFTDQMIGQWIARASALGNIHNPDHVRTALTSILAQSYQSGFGLRNCSWPGAKFLSDVPKNTWVDQANTCWSGVELAFASFLLYEGLYEQAMDVIRTVDTRYRKNGLYWDHQEFGGHYFRAMSGWAIVNGFLGLGINQGLMQFNPQIPGSSCKLFFAIPSGTAHFIKEPGSVTLRCLTGTLVFDQIRIKGVFQGAAVLRSTELLSGAGKTAGEDGYTAWKFEGPVQVRAGEQIRLS